MKRYTLDLRVVGYETISVEATSLEEAEERASEIVMQRQVSHLRWKEVQFDHLRMEDLEND